MKMRINAPEFEPRDIWVGAYWKVVDDFWPHMTLSIYICLIPMFPVRVDFHWIEPLT